MTINIIDAIMGAGKTSAAINYMKDNIDMDNHKYIYVTPYIPEVERVSKACQMKQPIKYTENTPKMIDLKRLLNKGANIVTTHVMFHLFDDEVIDLCYSQGYVLIMDEVTDVIQPYKIKQDDLNTLLDRYVDIGENGLLTWRDTNYSGDKFIEEKRLCDMGCLAVYGGEIMMWMFPIKIFNAFRESWILTYMFNAQMQKYYYDYYGLKYEYKYVAGDNSNNYYFTDIPQQYTNKYNYRELIYIYEDEKLNMIGDSNGALSKSWYIRNKDNILLKQLKNNLINYFNNKKVLYSNGTYIKSSAKNNLYTTFKGFEDKINGKGYAKAFLASNARATNAWKDRTVIGYPINKFFNPLIKQFFTGHGIEVDEDAYAISEMLQFIWRSGIRDGKHITVYIPSKRMRELLMIWIALQDDMGKEMQC